MAQSREICLESVLIYRLDRLQNKLSEITAGMIIIIIILSIILIVLALIYIK